MKRGNGSVITKD